MANQSRVYFIRGAAAMIATPFTTLSAEQAIFPPSTSQPRPIARNNHMLVEYPDAISSSIYFPNALAVQMFTSIVVRLYWASTVTVGSVLWGVAFERDAPAPSGFNLDVDSYAAEMLTPSVAPAVSGELQSVAFAFSAVQAGGLMPGEPYRLRVRRDGAAGADTLVGVAQLLCATLQIIP